MPGVEQWTDQTQTHPKLELTFYSEETDNKKESQSAHIM